MRRLTLVAALALCARAAAAQSAPLPLAMPLATPFLPVGHWSVDVARRLDAADRDVAFDGGMRTPPLADVLAVVTRAAARPTDDATRRLARGALARLREEFREIVPADSGAQPDVALGGALGVGVARATGRLRPGGGLLESVAFPPTPLPTASDVVAQAALGARVGRRVSLRVSVDAPDGRARVTDAQAVVAAGPIGLWAGRRAPAYGPSALGGVTVGGAASFDGAGAYLLKARALPTRYLRWIGPWHAEIFTARLDSNGAQRHPWFAGGRLSIAPLRVLQLGWSRGVIFGGDDNYAITPSRLLDVAFIGFRRGQSGFEDQVMSFDARVTPVIAGVPVVAHLEWGAEDAAGAMSQVPGIIAAIELPAVPRAEWLGLGVERASFPHSCCGNPEWARHHVFIEGWTARGALIGHPLGGEGRQLAAYARAEPFDARLRLRASAFTRLRGEENLFAPDRAGRSRGASASAAWRAGRVEAQASGVVERGASGAAWRAGALSGGVRVLF